MPGQLSQLSLPEARLQRKTPASLSTAPKAGRLHPEVPAVLPNHGIHRRLGSPEERVLRLIYGNGTIRLSPLR